MKNDHETQRKLRATPNITVPLPPRARAIHVNTATATRSRVNFFVKQLRGSGSIELDRLKTKNEFTAAVNRRGIACLDRDVLNACAEKLIVRQ